MPQIFNNKSLTTTHPSPLKREKKRLYFCSAIEVLKFYSYSIFNNIHFTIDIAYNIG